MARRRFISRAGVVIIQPWSCLTTPSAPSKGRDHFFDGRSHPFSGRRGISCICPLKSLNSQKRTGEDHRICPNRRPSPGAPACWLALRPRAGGEGRPAGWVLESQQYKGRQELSKPPVDSEGSIDNIGVPKVNFCWAWLSWAATARPELRSLSARASLPRAPQNLAVPSIGTNVFFFSAPS